MIFFFPPRIPFIACSKTTSLVLCDPGEGGNGPVPHRNYPQITQKVVYSLLLGGVGPGSGQVAALLGRPAGRRPPSIARQLRSSPEAP